MSCAAGDERVAVVDASVVVTVLAGGEHLAWAKRTLSSKGGGRSLWAPHLIDAEVGHALRRRAVAGKLEEGRAGLALRALHRLPLRRIVHARLLEHAWELRHNLSFYDALYVALAEQLDAPLLTLDLRLAKAVRGASRVTVETAC